MNNLQRWFKQRAPELERFLIGVTLILSTLLIVSQLLMTWGSVRGYLNRVDYLEGAPYYWPEKGYFSGDAGAASEQSVFTGLYWLELNMREGTGSLEVLRNGAVAGVLRSGSLIVYVKPGDRIEVRGEISGSEPATVEVKSVYGLLYPRAGDSIVTFGDNDLIGWVVPRN